MLAKIGEGIRRNSLFASGDRLLVAVSGGLDSCALLDALIRLRAEWGYELGVAHVDHRLRGEASQADARFVEALARRHRLPFHLGEVDVRALAEAQKLSIQAAAREARYAFLRETAERGGYGKIVTAHHADDQAETVMMRILRGTSTRGLGGIAVKRSQQGVEYVRPLLKIWREEIETYAGAHQIDHREDASNSTVKYLRNKIRLRLFPELMREYNGGVKAALLQLSDLAREDEQFLERLAAERFAECVTTRGSRSVQVNCEHFVGSALPLQRRVITLILYYLCGHTIQWEQVHIENIRALLTGSSPSARLYLPGGVQLRREYAIASVSVIEPSSAVEASIPPARFVFDKELLEGTLNLQVEPSGFDLRVQVEVTRGVPPRPTDAWEAQFDADQLSGSCIYIRTWEKGDRIQPLGLQGSKLISDVFVDAKVPKMKRSAWPLLCIDDKVEWVIGVRRGQQAQVTNKTQKTLILRAERLS
ncbi:tRNA lysidine(34) synthetase TilS [Tumebacillus lipolyticus]|uniref:tRNA(Ile)-lysidine synthase n=1 Tax=Tumebacillus lipolyticus TaxID=1280370 RepID=A0ABW4ZW84_9BACL